MNDKSGLELSTQSLIDAAIKRNLTVEVLDRADNFIRIKKNEKVEYIKQATKTALDPYIVPLIMENKEITKLILKEKNINVPAGVSVNSLEEGLKLFPDWENKALVIKPKNTNFGIGITIIKELKARDDFQEALQFAFSYDKTVLIETFIPGKEYRFLVIGDEVAGILHRVPANVKGDGVRTISELVIEKNKDPLRGKGYVTPLEKINIGETEIGFLKADNKTIETIPAQEEIVYLRENSNISTGGDSIDYTEIIGDDYKNIAIASAQAVGAKICGVDMMINDITENATKSNYSIIELNFNPALHIHNYPFKGKNRHVEEKILDLLGF
ncbi:bifunctional glutamate--cysteine ligase GshA/glutathione synthetase GshB [Eubacteriaceae bacterium ES3]|nr:bifunctional glutamate--cysteine ligase GshA/glutathione synthetase GshB [Eubacteriaceae bacterium ES3]